MTKIYTRTGDTGETSLFDGTRVSKADPRIDAYGDVDELNSVLGMARAAGVPPDVDQKLGRLQRDLFALGALLADPRHKIAARVAKAAINQGDVERLEQWIDTYETVLPPLRRFILPGGSAAGAALHFARTVCRRVERNMVALGADAYDPVLLVYVNRVSDLLFVLARAVTRHAGVAETEW